MREPGPLSAELGTVPGFGPAGLARDDKKSARYVISPKGKSASNSCNYLRCINFAESRRRYPFNQRGIWLRAAMMETENAPAP